MKVCGLKQDMVSNSSEQKKVVSCETKLHKIESIMRRNRLKIMSCKVTLKRINEIFDGEQR